MNAELCKPCCLIRMMLLMSSQEIEDFYLHQGEARDLDLLLLKQDQFSSEDDNLPFKHRILQISEEIQDELTKPFLDFSFSKE